jgi:Mrp family chromosome partitioning ATPase
MPLKRYFRLFRERFWLILLGTCLASVISFLIASGRHPVFEAQTIISIGRFLQVRNPDATDIRIGVELTQTYAQLATTQDVLQGTITKLNLPLTVEQLRTMVSTRVISDTSLLVISVAYPDPILVADIPNGIAQELILHSPTNLTPEQQQQLDLANQQVAQLNEQLLASRQQLRAIDDRLLSSQDQAEINRLTAQRNVTIDQINAASANIANFSSNIAMLQQNTNALDVVERAQVPSTPRGPSVLGATVLGSLVGGLLAIVTILLIDYLKDTIDTSEEARATVDLSVLGAVTRFGRRRGIYPDRLITLRDPLSPVSESFRAIQATLWFTRDMSNHIFVVTGPGPGEGKSVVTANLAVSFADAGLRTLLVDADLRHPTIHTIFGLPNEYGLSELLLSGLIRSSNGKRKVVKLEDVAEVANVSVSTVSRVLKRETRVAEETRHRVETALEETGYYASQLLAQEAAADIQADLLKLEKFKKTTEIANLSVITAGSKLSNPSQLFSSDLLDLSFNSLWNSPEFDIVLFDTPPCTLVADSSLIARKLDASVILVVQARRTRREAVLKAKDQLLEIGCKVRGIILNQADSKRESYGYGYERA